ncbi:MAG: DUF1028 domain-containing protein [Gammaproteobacteria bacterium]|nr:DUF1028 domain-containing protein [Gammaproteobacteria bacterium]
MTFSIVAIDRDTEAFGSAVASRSVAVGGTVAYSRVGVGVVNTQSYAHLTLGERVLDEMEKGVAPQDALARILRTDARADARQIIAIDVAGRRGAWSGSDCRPHYHQQLGMDCVAAGNWLTSTVVVDRMVEAFEHSAGRTLGERLMAALEAGEAAGGDSRGRQAAAVKVKPGRKDKPVAINLDLRVDDHPQPLQELQRLYRIFREEFR